ncbi:MAG: hypothetical protein LUH08_05620, partial [Ruminococcus sp.]|nr:hypothetical protein [Ruminococcus sp.]
MDDKKDLLNDEDRQYELERIEQEKAAIEEEKRRKEQEAEERKEYEKKLQEEHLELIKLKNGAITDSDIIKEVHEEK